MIEILDINDKKAVRNKDNILGLYDLMINQKKPVEAAAKYAVPGYIQHNPLQPNGSDALGSFFKEIADARPLGRVVIYKIMAVGDWVWAHINFLNLFNDDPDDTGIAGVDLFHMNDEGKALEHWDTLQIVGSPKNSAPWLGPDIQRLNGNKMF